MRDALVQLCGCSAAPTSPDTMHAALCLISNVTFANDRCCSIYCNSRTVALLLHAHASFPASSSVSSKIASIVQNMCDACHAARALFSRPQVYPHCTQPCARFD